MQVRRLEDESSCLKGWILLQACVSFRMYKVSKFFAYAAMAYQGPLHNSGRHIGMLCIQASETGKLNIHSIAASHAIFPKHGIELLEQETSSPSSEEQLWN